MKITRLQELAGMVIREGVQDLEALKAELIKYEKQYKTEADSRSRSACAFQIKKLKEKIAAAEGK